MTPPTHQSTSLSSWPPTTSSSQRGKTEARVTATAKRQRNQVQSLHDEHNLSVSSSSSSSPSLFPRYAPFPPLSISFSKSFSSLLPHLPRLSSVSCSCFFPPPRILNAVSVHPNPSTPPDGDLSLLSHHVVGRCSHLPASSQSHVPACCP